MKLLLVAFACLAAQLALADDGSFNCPGIDNLKGRKMDRLFARVERSCSRMRLQAAASREEKKQLREEQKFERKMHKLVDKVKHCAMEECPAESQQCLGSSPECMKLTESHENSAEFADTCCAHTQCIHACFDGTARGRERRQCVSECLKTGEECCNMLQDGSEMEQMRKCGDQWDPCMIQSCENYKYCSCHMAKLTDFIAQSGGSPNPPPPPPAEKEGTCPPATISICVAPECSEDSECGGTMKCCDLGCTRQCQEPQLTEPAPAPTGCEALDCPEGQTCELQQVQCFTSPCPP